MVDRNRLGILLHSSSKFRTRNHIQYISEAMEALRHGLIEGRPDPGFDALATLAALWRSGFADRTEPKMALNDVGRWLEQQLRHYGPDGASELLIELGWLKRSCRYNDRVAKTEDKFGQAPDRSRVPRREFGDDLEGLRAKRQKAQIQVEKAQRRQAAEEAKKPKKLPNRFEVTFESFTKAREACANAKKRLKKKKLPKEVQLPVIPVDDALKPLAEGLVCSTTETEGFMAYFEAVQKAGGKQVPMFAEGIASSENRLLMKLGV